LFTDLQAVGKRFYLLTDLQAVGKRFCMQQGFVIRAGGSQALSVVLGVCSTGRFARSIRRTPKNVVWLGSVMAGIRS
jgi:hypothetical protein